MAKRLRILHAPTNAANQQSELSKALNKIPGIESHYMFFGEKKVADKLILSGIDYDLSYKNADFVNYSVRMLKQFRFFLHAMNYYDIIHLSSNLSLLHPLSYDIPILKRLGKKIVMSYWGCDARRRDIDSKYRYSACKTCPKKDCREKWKEKKIAYLERLADLQLVHGPESLEYVPKAELMPIALDTDFWRPIPYKKQEKTIRIMHPVWNLSKRGDTKGTKVIKKAVETLKKEGLDVDFLFKDDLPHKDMLSYYAKADIVVEQLRFGWHGATAGEAMACEKPVVAYLRPDLIKYYPDIPIASANCDNLVNELRKLVKNKKLRDSLGKKGREFVIKHYDSKKVALQLVKKYKSL